MLPKFILFFACTTVLAQAGDGTTALREKAPAQMTLEQAYDRALATDQTIALALQAVVQSDLQPARALTRLTPRLNGTLGTDQNGNTDKGLDFDRNNGGRARVALSQPLVDPTVGPAYRAGLLTAQESRLDYRTKIRDTALVVASSYFEVLQQQALVTVNKESLRLAGEQKKLAEERLSVGEVIRTDVLTADVTLQRARRTLVGSENALRLARTLLANVLNYDPGSEIGVVEPEAYALPAEDLPGLRERARRQRDDLQRLLTTVLRRGENLSETRASYLPSITASVSAGRNVNSSSTSDGTDGQTDYSAGLSVSIPLLNGGEKALDLKRDAAEIAKARLDYEKAVKQSDEEVTTAFLDTRTLQQTLISLRAEVKSAEENYSLLQQQYRLGESKSLDVLQALTDLNTSRTDLAVSLYQYQLACRELAARTADFEKVRVEKAAALARPTPPPAGRHAS
jgi:outer membrane protein TolC